jgi:hypothetical protein
MVLTQANSVQESLLKAPISADLLIPCRLAYPLRELSLDSDLRGLYSTLQHNLGQTSKCYYKDEQLILEVIKSDRLE